MFDYFRKTTVYSIFEIPYNEVLFLGECFIVDVEVKEINPSITRSNRVCCTVVVLYCAAQSVRVVSCVYEYFCHNVCWLFSVTYVEILYCVRNFKCFGKRVYCSCVTVFSLILFAHTLCATVSSIYDLTYLVPLYRAHLVALKAILLYGFFVIEVPIFNCKLYQLRRHLGLAAVVPVCTLRM